MEIGEPSAARPGLRERKKQQTRDTISRVALQLFAERGYDQTTLVEIADAANISKRTIFAYFQSKEDILFSEEERYSEDLKRRLDERPPGTTTIDAIRDFVSSVQPPDEAARLRTKIVSAGPTLQMRMRARQAQLEPLIAESIAKDLGVGPEDVRPVLFAAAMTAAFAAVRQRFFEAESGGQPLSHEEGIRMLDDVLEFLRAGFEALRRE